MLCVAGVAEKLRLATKDPSTSHAAEHFEENPLELLPKDTVDDEVDRTVDGDEEVIGLGEGMV